MIISRDICLRRKKKERKPSDTLVLKTSIRSSLKVGEGVLSNQTLTEEPTRICRIFSFRLQKCQSVFLICTGSSGAHVLNPVNRTVAGLYITDEEAFT